jgi:predicted Zn-dependent peptidase
MARDNLYVVVVGAIDREATAAALDKVFGGLPQHAQLTPVPEIVPAVGQVRHAALNVPQTAIRIGGVGLKRDDPDFIAAYVADQILGGGTFSSRLYTAVREERGLAYSVGTGCCLTSTRAPPSQPLPWTPPMPMSRWGSCSTNQALCEGWADGGRTGGREGLPRGQLRPAV